MTTTLSDLHIHQPTATADIECADCAHHVQHHSHLSADSDSLHDCVLCQFLSLAYTAATMLAVVLFATAARQGRLFLCSSIAKREPSLLSTRGPPAIL